MRVSLWFLLFALMSGCQAKGPVRPAESGSLCDAVFSAGKERFVGRGYSKSTDSRAGFLWLSLTPKANVESSGYALKGTLRSFFGGKLYRRVGFDRGHCVDAPDQRFAVIHLYAESGAHMRMWMWGESGLPQHDDRLMGYVKYASAGHIDGKIALWRR